jgi:hypothetical protein
MGLKKVTFGKPSKYPLTYSVVVGNTVSRSLMFHGSHQLAEQTGFVYGDFYEVYFDSHACAMQIQKLGAKKRDSRQMRRMSHKGKVVGGFCFSFTSYPFEGFFPNGNQIPLEILKAEPGVLLFRIPRDVPNINTNTKS